MRTIITQITFHDKGAHASCRLAYIRTYLQSTHTLDRNITAGPVHTKLY